MHLFLTRSKVGQPDALHIMGLQIPKQKRASGITEFGYECLEVAALEEREITRKCFFSETESLGVLKKLLTRT